MSQQEPEAAILTTTFDLDVDSAILILLQSSTTPWADSDTVTEPPEYISGLVGDWTGLDYKSCFSTTSRAYAKEAAPQLSQTTSRRLEWQTIRRHQWNR